MRQVLDEVTNNASNKKYYATRRISNSTSMSRRRVNSKARRLIRDTARRVNMILRVGLQYDASSRVEHQCVETIRDGISVTTDIPNKVGCVAEHKGVERKPSLLL